MFTVINLVTNKCVRMIGKVCINLNRGLSQINGLILTTLSQLDAYSQVFCSHMHLLIAGGECSVSPVGGSSRASGQEGHS